MQLAGIHKTRGVTPRLALFFPRIFPSQGSKYWGEDGKVTDDQTTDFAQEFGSDKGGGPWPSITTTSTSRDHAVRCGRFPALLLENFCVTCAVPEGTRSSQACDSLGVSQQCTWRRPGRLRMGKSSGTSTCCVFFLVKFVGNGIMEASVVSPQGHPLEIRPAEHHAVPLDAVVAWDGESSEVAARPSRNAHELRVARLASGNSALWSTSQQGERTGMVGRWKWRTISYRRRWNVLHRQHWRASMRKKGLDEFWQKEAILPVSMCLFLSREETQRTNAIMAEEVCGSHPVTNKVEDFRKWDRGSENSGTDGKKNSE